MQELECFKIIAAKNFSDFIGIIENIRAFSLSIPLHIIQSGKFLKILYQYLSNLVFNLI